MRENPSLDIMVVLLALNVIATPPALDACSLSRLPSSEEMCRKAAYVVRVTSLQYGKPPAWGWSTTGIPDSTVVFRVEEILKGTDLPAKMAIKGYLSDYDDFNDRPAPYPFVRPGGRHGSCFANSYKTGAQFLLFLQKRGDEYTPYWYAAGPVNEQLHGASDPWVRWVKEYLRAQYSGPSRLRSRLCGVSRGAEEAPKRGCKNAVPRVRPGHPLTGLRASWQSRGGGYDPTAPFFAHIP